MPLKKQPQSLEQLGLNCVEKVVIQVCKNAAEKCSDKFYMQKISSGASFTEVDKGIDNLQDLLFLSTAHYFHKEICEQILWALSNLLHGQAENGEGPSYLHQSQEERRKLWLKDQIILRFSTLLCHPEVHQLTLPVDLDLGLVKALCAAIPDMPSLVSLNLGTWQCRKHGLLSLASHQDGYSLMFIKNLSILSVTDVSLDFIINVSTFCPNLRSLTISKSEVNDEATSYISNLRKLKILQLKDATNISPFGYAELLRNLHELCSLGRCDSFGEVITTLYHKWSVYKRSVGTIPGFLALEKVDCEGPISDYELHLISNHCPNMRNMRLVYNPVVTRGNDSESELPDLAVLSKISNLDQLGIMSADFYSHSLFTVIKTTGGRLTHLELTNVDELNLASLMMIGDHCKLLTHLNICCCHYTPEASDRNKLEQACTLQAQTKDRRPFSKLKSASFILTTSTHIPILKYPIFFALNLEELKLNQIYQPLEDSFISSLVSWNPLQSLVQFSLTNGPHLTLMAANILIQACPKLRQIGQVSSWGRVERDELVAFKREIVVRNLDIVIE